MIEKKNLLVSVIVPVYRKEDTLNECIKSIIAQSYEEIEIILIDDGSPDRCGNICDSYVSKDDRIKVIHKENEGVSIARNVGLTTARGQYITFIDADDVIDRNFIKNLLLSCADSSDIVAGSNRPVNKSFKLLLGRDDAIKRMFDDDNFGVNVWGKLFKKDIVENIRFPEYIAMGEDMAFMFECLLKSKNIVYISDSNYIQNVSTYNSFNLSNSYRFDEALQIVINCKVRAINEGIESCIDTISKAIVLRALWTVNVMIARDELNDETLIRCRREIQLNKKIIRQLSLKHKILTFVLMVGTTFYVALFGFAIRRRYNAKRSEF